MLDLNSIRDELETSADWEERADGLWLLDARLDVERMAQVMLAGEARLSTITATPFGERECRLAYHWDSDGRLLTFVTRTHAGHIASVSAICPAADWIEREIHDYFAVTFTGRESEPLVLRTSDAPGLFRNGRHGGAR